MADRGGEHYMKLVRQPEGSSLCGQACVATIAGVSLEESIQAFCTRGGTHTWQLVKALRKLGLKCGDKPIRLTNRRQKPSTCIVRLHFDGYKFTHWTVYHDGVYLDPDLGVLTEYPEGVRETSYLPVYLEG